jgi:hypothetical protein
MDYLINKAIKDTIIRKDTILFEVPKTVLTVIARIADFQITLKTLVARRYYSQIEIWNTDSTLRSSGT